MAHEIEHKIEQIAADVARLRIAFVNCFFIGAPRRAAAKSANEATPWVLVDAALSVGAARILEVAAERFGEDARPTAIILTHGHFDHIGALEALLGIWDVPVYAHPLELPFLTGRADYPPPDPTVGKGLMARMAPLFPERGIDLGHRAKELPANAEAPGMPGWRVVHTPGHSPGHVSLFRASDRLLIAGDAVVTTRQESVFAVAMQKEELNGPPAYFTIDWDAAHRSVSTLASLKPVTITTGHGPTMRGEDLAQRLAGMARDFDERVRPRHGRYVREPAITNEDGVVYVPAPARGGVPWGTVSGVAAAAVAGTWLVRRFGRRAQAAPPAQASPAVTQRKS
jgi:glyoxylase-like metal-dependent hydrolase (beta-lactamase superfamily II)